MQFLKTSLALAIIASALLAGSAMAAAPKIQACADEATGGVVKDVKKVGSNTVMTFADSKLKITVPSKQKEAKDLLKAKPGTLYCLEDDTNV